MRLKGRQLRFVIGSTAAWAAGRIAAKFGAGGWIGLGTVAGVTVAGIALLPWPGDGPRAAFRAVPPPGAPAPVRPAPPPGLAPLPWEDPRRAPELVALAAARVHAGSHHALLRHALFAAPAEENAVEEGGAEALPAAPPGSPRPARAEADTRWEASAYLFLRPGEGVPNLAGGGALGGSQAAARITYRLGAEDAPTRFALAARAYAPLRGEGAEAAAGIDWHPLPNVPFRLSAERRVGLDPAGRNAWSAYAAGGFFAEPAPGWTVDGYAQSGVVGARRRDLFADGGLRGGRRVAVGKAALIGGAGLWGAAQPGVERLDAGPRVAAILPVADRTLAIALEGRIRLAGDARPGSGAALTVGVDF